MKTLLIGVLATFRLTLLFVEEDGPNDILARFRYTVGIRQDEFSRSYGQNVFAEMLICFWCASIWFAAFIALITAPRKWFTHTLAYSAGAILFREWIKK